MAQNVTIAGASYSDVPSIDIPKTDGGIAKFYDVSEDTVTSSTLLEDITAHNSAGAKITGTVKHRFFQGEIVSTVVGSSAYAVLLQDAVIAEHFYDPNLWIKVTFDIESTPYTVVETWGFNTTATNSDIRDRTGQQVLRYDSSGGRNFNQMGAAINAVNITSSNAGVGRIEITQTGEVRIHSRSNNYAIRPSKYTVEVNWNA